MTLFFQILGTIGAALFVAITTFVAHELRSMRIEMAEWRVVLFGTRGSNGIVQDVRRLQGMRQRHYDDLTESDV